jgi:hypothetical protein
MIVLDFFEVLVGKDTQSCRHWDHDLRVFPGQVFIANYYKKMCRSIRAPWKRKTLPATPIILVRNCFFRLEYFMIFDWFRARSKTFKRPNSWVQVQILSKYLAIIKAGT